MTWQWSPFVIAEIAASAILFITAVYTLWLKPLGSGSATNTGFCLLIVAVVWMMAHALEIGSSDLVFKDFWNKVQFMCIFIGAEFYLIFTLSYISNKNVLRLRNIALLGIIHSTIFLLVFTNDTHNLIWTNVKLSDSNPFLPLEAIKGVGAWAFYVFALILLIITTSIIFRWLPSLHRVYHRHTKMLMFGILLIFPLAAIDILDFETKLQFWISPIPWGFTIAGLLMVWAFSHVRLKDVLPVVRESVIQSMNDIVMVLDNHNRILDLNPAAESLTGYTIKEALGKPVEQIWHNWSSHKALSGAASAGNHEVVMNNGDERLVFDISISALSDFGGQTVSRVITLHDITERKRAEEEIRASLREKEVLLREIHHRVKNNLQVISSMLHLQSKNIKDKQILELFQESQNRIKSMALIHEKLYQSKDLVVVDLADYIRSLTNYLLRSYGANTNVIKLNISIKDILLDIDTAILTGLIINELVSNSLKHAFPDGREGEICTDFHPDNSNFTLIVGDNGVGFPQDLDFRNTDTLGLQLVNTLVKQLNGTIGLDRSGGTAFKIKFREPNYNEKR